ncbi:ATP-binding protein [Shewanella baltica]|uniref:ATP-binding protein n=1 Tax=Shewanella baltica TaxID=62322 RepID=UPI00217ED875|nr:ATP-binding protein [Shewanella baltica]MCS6175587.1 two-component sensor histidine kinase [Shewanella baltica]
MKKSLLSLAIIVILSVVGIQLFIIPLFENKVRHPTEKWALELLTSGTANMLAVQLQRLPKQDRAAYLQNMQANFGYELAVQDYQRDDFSIEQQQWIDQNNVVGEPLTDLVYRRIDADQLLVVIKPNTVPKYLVNDAQRWSMGVFYLITHALNQQPENNWHSIIAVINEDFAYPVTLQSLGEIHENDEQMSDLYAGRIIALSTADSDAIGYPADRVMQRIGSSDKVIVLGPFSTELKPKVQYMLSIFYLIFGLSLLVPIIVWLIPAWRSMLSLNKVAILLGKGHFDTRAKFIHFSHLNHLSNTINIMAEKIQRLISSHKNLVNAVSHELRTPIARIEFNIEMLRNNTQDNNQLTQLDRIEFSLNELNSLVSEMLEHARFDSEIPTLTFESIELNHWLRQELLLWQEANPTIVITLLGHDECLARFDRFYMSRAISNLVRNAIAYGQSQIHVGYQKTAKGWMAFIEDDGYGVPLASRDKVFEPFYRDDESRNLQKSGTGLGLAIVKQIIDWHSGSASVNASALGGARFVLSWPDKKL